MAANPRAMKRSQLREVAKATTITATLGELLNSQPALGGLSRQPLPAPLAFKLSKIIKAVNRELETCNETRIKLCEQFGGVKNEKEDRYKFESPEQEQELEREFNELVKTPVTIAGDRLHLDRLPNLTMSAGDVLALSWLIADE